MTVLTVSGNEITDAVRTTNTQGDGVTPPDSSMGIWEVTTNQILNGGFETNATGWTAVSAAAPTRVTSQFKFGAASGEIVTSNLAANEGAYHNFTATAAVWTISAWVRGNAGGTVRLAVRDNAGANPQTGTPITLTTTFQRITFTTTALTAAVWRLYVETDVQQNITFQVDGAQAELKPLATPYVQTDGAAAARLAARVQAPVSLLTANQGWVAFRVRMGFGAAAPANPTLFSYDDGSTNNRVQIRYSVTWVINTVVATVSQTNVIVADSFNRGDMRTVILAWTTAQTKLSVNGAAFVAQNTSKPIGLTNLDIGQTDGTGLTNRQIDSDILWFATGTGTLSDADAAAINAIGNTDPTPTQISALASQSAVTAVAPMITTAVTDPTAANNYRVIERRRH